MPPGPLPQTTRRRRNPPTIPTTELPADGRKGPVPKPPAWVRLGDAGTAWWKWAWRTPQAAAWDAGALVVVAHRASLEDDLATISRAGDLDGPSVHAGGGDTGDGERDANSLVMAREARQRKAYELRVSARLPYRVIGEQLGVSTYTAFNDVALYSGLAAPMSEQEMARREAVELYERLLREMLVGMAQAEGGDKLPFVTRIAETQARLDKARAAVNVTIARVAGLASSRVTVVREAREIDGKLGLTPKGLADLRWKIIEQADDDVPAGVTNLDDRRRRLGNA